MADLTCTGGFITPTEIVNAINARVEENANITAGTNTKITYDVKGLVTVGEAATTADIAASTDKNYVTDAEATVIDNTSGTNSGNQSSGDFTHNDLTGVDSNEHIDWTLTAAGTIHTDNYIENVPTALSEGTRTATTYGITSDGGTDDIELPEANTTEAGLLGADKWDEIVANSLKTTNSVTNLTQTTAPTTLTVHSSDGTDVSILEASDTIAGVMTTTHHDKLDGIEASADVNLTTGEMEGVISHDNLQNITANDHIDWTIDDALVIHSANYTNTEYGGGTGITLNAGDFDHDAHDGDVAGSTTLTIGNDKVTYAKMQNVVNDERVLGRVSGAAGNIEELTAAQMKTMLGYLTDLLNDTSPQLGGDLDFNGKTMNESAVRQATDDSGSGTVVFDYATEDMIQYTATGNLTTLTFSNFPSGDVAGYIIDAINWGNYEITHPSGMLFTSGITPTYTTSGTDRILVTSDKDGILTLTIISENIKAV